MLSTHPALTELTARGNKIGARGAEAFARALHANSTLVTLDLSFNALGPEAGQHLAMACRVNTTLGNLDLRVTKQQKWSSELVLAAMMENAVDTRREFKVITEPAMLCFFYLRSRETIGVPKVSLQKVHAGERFHHLRLT